MHNYQLYRTNPRLSGQLKWDLTIDAYDGELYVENMGLTPLFNSLRFVKNPKGDLLRNTHQENVRLFYERNKNIFFNANGDKKLDGPLPTIEMLGGVPDSSQFDITYNMGVRRVSHKLYRKQFAILAPVWLEKVNDAIRFRFDKYVGSTYIGCKYLTLHDNKDSGKQIHNSFTNYFFNYVKYMHLNDSENWRGDELMYIDLKTGLSSIYGLNVTNGQQETKGLLYLSRNLRDREMPMMEFDEKILNEFEKNRIISPQLFNFNFIFDIDDMLNEWEKQQFSNLLTQFNIKINVEIKTGEITEVYKDENGQECNRIVEQFEQLPIADFYNNYEFISKIDSSNNVLDYLRDYSLVSMIDKNKLCPTIFHWSLNDNDSYIFNLYDGFSATNTSKNYDGAPNLFAEDYRENLFNDKWMCKSSNDLWYSFSTEFESLAFLEDIENGQIDNYRKHMTQFKKGNTWVNNVKYNSTKDIYIGVFRVRNTRAIKEKLTYTNEQEVIFHPLLEKEGNTIIFYKYDFENGMPYFVFICLEISNEVKSCLTFPSLMKIEKFSEIFENFDRFDNPPIITIGKSVRELVRTDGPSLNSDELEDYRWTSSNTYLYRYFGKLRPSFINITHSIDNNVGRINKLYYKIKIPRNVYKTSIYNYYGGSKFPPKYPSIGYYLIDSLPMTYQKLPKINFNGKPTEIILNNEESWFNISNMLYIPANMEWRIEYEVLQLL